MTIDFCGNKDLLKLPKTAFLASNTISSESVLRCYDWATEMRHQGRCVVSGFSSCGFGSCRCFCCYLNTRRLRCGRAALCMRCCRWTVSLRFVRRAGSSAAACRKSSRYRLSTVRHRILSLLQPADAQNIHPPPQDNFAFLQTESILRRRQSNLNWPLTDISNR